jgi:hypothetical protein
MPDSWHPLQAQPIEIVPDGLESAFDGRRLMRPRISNRAIATIQVIGWMAIMIVMGMFLTVIGAGITECLANPR